MDNGLIFPYPCVRVPDESVVLTTQNRAHQSPSGVRGFGAAWDLLW
jgi:hypothetical protein